MSKPSPHGRPARRFGPGLWVAAAFIGPGTVTTATLAGASHGFALAWAAAFSVVATILLQAMSARLGLAARQGLGEAIRSTFGRPAPRFVAAGLVIAAIGCGNAAFQTGNFLGAALGLELLTGIPARPLVAVLAVTAFVFLAAGGHRAVGVFLAALVALMALVFCATAAALSPPVDQLAHGLVVPSIPPDSLTLIVALIGTTVVPYNLFLHASSVKFTWPREVPLDVALQECRRDCVVSIAIGGVITLTILVCAGAFYSRGMRIESAVQMAEQMAPLLGSWAKWFFAVGLLAAGFSSALTAPLAAAHAICGVLGWNTDFRSARFRAVWITVLVIGAGLALRQKLFLPAIVFAQAANGVLLPLIAGFLLVVVNRKALLGEYRNGWAANVAGGAVILVAAGLGFSQLAAAIQKTWR